MSYSTRKKDNRRIKMSKLFLKEALVELLQNKSLKKITIKELCETADINPSTFYANYTDKQMLLDEIENDYLTDIASVFHPMTLTPDITELTERFEIVIQHYLNHRKIHFALYNSKQLDFYRNISRTNHEMLRLWNSGTTVSADLENYIYTYSVYGSIALLHQWLLQENRLPPDEMAAFLAKITIAQYSAVFNPQ